MKGYELKITLMDYNKAFKDAQNKGVWFKLQAPESLTFDELHRIIIASTNWDGYHMYSFEFKKLKINVQDKDDDAYPLGGAESFMQSIKQQILSGKIDLSNLKNGEAITSVDFNMKEFPKNDTSESLEPPKTKLIDLFEKEKMCRYMYDFGDGWECKIDAKPLDEFDGIPAILDFYGKWPPEDCGGIGGYADILKLLQKAEAGDKKAQKHEKVKWLKSMRFDDFCIDGINAELKNVFTKKKSKK